tara:strand:- start:457 stop:600 length:144 start_codon:yes stop_codon:yes gene_type:complete
MWILKKIKILDYLAIGVIYKLWINMELGLANEYRELGATTLVVDFWL